MCNALKGEGLILDPARCGEAFFFLGGELDALNLGTYALSTKIFSWLFYMHSQTQGADCLRDNR